uniref:Uncharacterized protein n=1 Tax=Meloidogyne hapla TaxID=6305 RepID=A0A1I8BXJ8_MELHA
MTHKLFRKEIENNHKKTTGYVCKKFPDNVDYCNCVINGKLPTNFNYPNPDSDDFMKIATARFFGDKKPDNVAKDNEHKQFLVLLDGCATCSKGGTITGLRVTHFEESGGFFSRCSETKEYEAYYVPELKITIPASNKVDIQTASFAVPVTLRHRVCSNIFNTYPASDKYLDIKLHIENNCGGTKSTKIINLPSIDITFFKDRVAEFRGLWINLDNGKTKQYARKGHSYKLNEKLAETWMYPRVDCWTKKDACKLN